LKERLRPHRCLPADAAAATLVGRAWVPGEPGGPCIVAIRGNDVVDLTPIAPTMSDLLDADEPAATVARGAQSAPPLGGLAAILANSIPDGDPGRPRFLAPCDLQAIKASGVTFIASLLERVIEEQARGDAARAEQVRRTITEAIGSDLADVRPGSEHARKLKRHACRGSRPRGTGRGTPSYYLPPVKDFTYASSSFAVYRPNL
jgi:fumarylacetoacetate (FAA) hydrolase family protein